MLRLVAVISTACVAASGASCGSSNGPGAPTQPAALFASAIAFDATRGRLVIFGGEGPNRVQPAETWEWDGSTWSRASATGPSGRFWASMAYDPTRHVLVMFGGATASSILGDTWEYDGTTWRSAATTGPAPRYAHELIYDAVRQRVLLFGGRDQGTAYSDLWEWNGTQWQQVSSGSAPAGRAAHAMSYDTDRSRLVVFGGFGPPFAGTPTIYADSWEWDGAQWSQRAIGVPGPSARDHVSMAFDAARHRMVLFGGHEATSTSALIDTWEWDGQTWQRSADGPSVEGGHRLTYDTRRQRVVLWTGTGNTSAPTTLWEWDGTRWGRMN